ncbi:Kdo hydroxylase family protein [Pseudomonas silvicola]|nr:Kdo hydroxylase family protein [Pseudomonas silvicola]
MTEVVSLPLTAWSGEIEGGLRARGVEALEAGAVLAFPALCFQVRDDELDLLAPQVGAKSKNISLSPGGDALKGVEGDEARARRIQQMIGRFADQAEAMARSLLAPYAGALQRARTSFRPEEIAGRQTSWRKDDTRLHVDNFPSSPTRGKRILRVFANINPAGEPRHWRLGEPFERLAERYVPALPRPLWGSAQVLNALGITKAPRSAYDHYMLHLHDRMKADQGYQRTAPQSTWEFAAGSAWMVFTDQVSHAATQGKCALEQTFLLPVQAMQDGERAPLRVLERLMARKLA